MFHRAQKPGRDNHAFHRRNSGGCKDLGALMMVSTGSTSSVYSIMTFTFEISTKWSAKRDIIPSLLFYQGTGSLELVMHHLSVLIGTLFRAEYPFRLRSFAREQ